MHSLSHYIKKNICGLSNPQIFIGNNEIPVFMFHRILKSNSCNNLDRNISLNIFEFKNALATIEKYFKVICLKKYLYDKKIPRERSCILTFDDGWHDNYQNVFPILKEHGLPATIFVPTSLIGTNERFWFLRLADAINNSRFFEKDILCKFSKLINLRKSFDHNSKKDAIYSEFCSTLKNMNPMVIDSYLDQIEAELPIENKVRSIMNWDEIEDMSNHNISFGSHGQTHSILTTLTRRQKIHEIFTSREKLIEKKNVNYVNCISFPNGNYDQEILDISLKSGYSLFFSASINKCGVGESPLLNKRINISSDIIANGYFNYILIKAKIKNGFLKSNLMFNN